MNCMVHSWRDAMTGSPPALLPWIASAIRLHRAQSFTPFTAVIALPANSTGPPGAKSTGATPPFWTMCPCSMTKTAKGRSHHEGRGHCADQGTGAIVAVELVYRRGD